MCGRYYLADFTEDEVKEYFSILEELDKKIKNPSYKGKVKMHGEIFPSDIVPVIAKSHKNELKAFGMEWGYTLYNGDRLINARSETATEKKTWAIGMNKHRCLIPASYYYEWEKQSSGKVKHAIHPKGAEVMYMAGVYRTEVDKHVFSILTREAAPDIEFLHDRMPVILPKEIHEDWLNIDNNSHEVIKDALQYMEHRVAQ